MLSMKKYVAPESLQDAWSLYSTNPNNVILGGCAFLKMGKKKIATGIDLCNLGLEYIKEYDDFIEIGAMTKLRAFETNKDIKKHFGTMLEKSVSNIVGVPFRNTVTVGGSVFGRYGFSDVITALLALNAEIELYKGGHMTLSRYLKAPPKFDILTAIRIPKVSEASYHYEAVRHSSGDFPILTTAVSRSDKGYTITVGARPMRAKKAKNAMAFLNDQFEASGDLSQSTKEKVAELVCEELNFGSNMRAKDLYRKHLCKVLVMRGLNEVSNEH